MCVNRQKNLRVTDHRISIFVVVVQNKNNFLERLRRNSCLLSSFQLSVLYALNKNILTIFHVLYFFRKAVTFNSGFLCVYITTVQWYCASIKWEADMSFDITRDGTSLSIAKFSSTLDCPHGKAGLKNNAYYGVHYRFLPSKIFFHPKTSSFCMRISTFCTRYEFM